MRERRRALSAAEAQTVSPNHVTGSTPAAATSDELHPIGPAMAKEKKFLRDTSVYDRLEDLDLMIDEKYLYLWLTINRDITISGLYEVNRRAMCYNTGISRDRIDACLQHLADRALLVYDAELMFIPQIPEEQNIEGRRGWQSHLERMRSEKSTWRSDLPGSPNMAYDAFLRHHAERFHEIDEAARMDAEEAYDSEDESGVADMESADQSATLPDDLAAGEDANASEHPFDVAMAANGRRQARRQIGAGPEAAASAYTPANGASDPVEVTHASDCQSLEATARKADNGRSDCQSLAAASPNSPPDAKSLQQMQQITKRLPDNPAFT
ncbi:MAG: hypothetical protein FGM24_04500 [Candidatus Kapabacteria bacterium]|nr:hypothetical protein [Candidatus Kapabacteria bacterium]